MKKILLFLVATLVMQQVSAQISLTTQGQMYSQDFDTYSGTTLTIPTGWGVGLGAMKGTGSGSGTAGGYYAFGTSNEYAFGVLRSSTATFTLTVSFKNETGNEITALDIAYNFEQWRYGGGSNTTGLTASQTGMGAADVSALSQAGVNGTANPTGGLTTAKTLSLTGLTIANNATFTITFTAQDFTGADNGVAVDDFSLTVVTVLPVELTAFTATATDKGTALAWATASEENNRAFEVQRSANGRDFETIATVAGAGTTYEAQNYNYLDAQPLNGVNYYRLKQVDFDGSFELHRVVAVLFAAKGNAVAVLPTEVTTQFDLVFGEALATDAQVQIYNFGGQLLHSETVAAGNQRQTIDAAAFAAGIYVVRVQNNGVSTAARFVKL
jgi:hypothetical protein